MTSESTTVAKPKLKSGSKSKPVRRSATAKRGLKAKAALARPQPALGWNTSDEHEIALRQWRGRTEIVAVEALEPAHRHFGAFRARSEKGRTHEVEIRSLAGLDNSCDCIDHRVNGLGTCKHIEGVLAALRRTGVRAFQQATRGGSPRTEVFLARQGDDPRPLLRRAAASEANGSPTEEWLAPYLTADGALDPCPERIACLVARWAEAPAEVRARLRVSRHLAPWIERHRRAQSRVAAREAFLAEEMSDPGVFDLLSNPLLPYQREGVLHLAFGERALLADDMGLGKTAQAIAACELLARRRGVERVLVVCPASLKTEWEEQIARFTRRSAASVFGPRAARLARYRDPAFFTIVNYEQVLIDDDILNSELRADIVVLDEAQRIKNWHTKTADKIKALRSPYAFVLTGTPVENRIDELYSIVQFLDPELVGSLFRFNRRFYQLDERGRPIEYRNLAELQRRVAPVILRRRKSDVEPQLPGRTVKTYFVPMAPEQEARYEDYRAGAVRLASIAKRRPLQPKEFDRLQMLLACMRMVCDTPAILDPTCRVCPKLEELEGILGDLLREPGRKIIIFSEWERMLALVRDLAGEMGVEAAWHTGSVPQIRRREEINRFKQDPDCRLFLSTDSGSVGLNLQVASAVINLDLPWNPAKLEQRIARAWRKNQTRSVTVINLVTQNSIEHSMLGLLGAKQALSDGLLDGVGEVSALKMPSGRGSLVQRMADMLDAEKTLAPRIVAPEDAMADGLRQRHGEALLRVEVHTPEDGAPRLLAVLDLDGAALEAEVERLSRRADAAAMPVEVVDRATWDTLRRLAKLGLVKMAEGSRRLLHATLDPVETAVDGVEAAAGDGAAAPTSP